jgi:Na+-translocating ferredoxin:NAD+ oxidoreductase RnfE subunit
MDIAAANNASGSCWWEAWLYPTNAATSRIIYHNTMTSLVDYLIVGAIAGPSFLASARGAASNSMSCALTLNTWQHILVQRSGLFITAIYKNGVSSGGAAGAAFGGGALNAHIIGCYSTGALFYIGSIGEMGFHLGTVRATLPRHLYESTRHEYGV